MTEFVFRFRNKLAALPMIYVILSTRWEWENVWGVWLLAGLLTGSGILVRLWSNQHCNYNRRAQNILAHTGPYALGRNPLYVGNALAILGAIAASGLIWMIPITLVWMILIFNVVVRREEPKMLAKYGELYADYCKRVPRWLPSLATLLPTKDGRRVLFRDMSIALILLPFVAKQLKWFGLWS
ncbi:MAG: protein-S-isoprenylcysteine O-methyltransferase Ste14 [Pseudohongiellaceae bacterium]|jgi:protein-S-isoprenylcysteine O-methyltransferase Ste14